MNTTPDKRFATLQATAALNGITLHQMSGDFSAPIYIGTRWAMTKQMDSLDEVSGWLQRVTGKTVELAQ
jgi:hypothetical protein